MIVWGSVGMFVVYRPFLKIVGFYPWSVVVWCKGCDGCCVFVCIVTRGAVGARVWEV